MILPYFNKDSACDSTSLRLGEVIFRTFQNSEAGAFNAGMMGSLVPKAGLRRGLALRAPGEPRGEPDLRSDPRSEWQSPVGHGATTVATTMFWQSSNDLH